MPATLDVASLATLYLADLAARAGAAHVRKSTAQIRRLCGACPGPTVAEVYAFRAQRLREGVGRRTVEMEISAVRAMFAWAVRGRLVAADPLADLPPLAIRQGDLRRRPREFSTRELQAFLAAADRRDVVLGGVPQAPCWTLLAATGLRWGEAAALTRAHLIGPRLHVPASAAKARRARIVPVPEDLARWFARFEGPLLRGPRGSPWATAGHSSVHRRFRDTMRDAGLTRRDAAGRILTIHSFRRTAGVGWSREGLPLQFVSRLLGHADPDFTERWYLETKAEDAVEAIFALRRKKSAEAVEKKSRDGESAASHHPETDREEG